MSIFQSPELQKAPDVPAFVVVDALSAREVEVVERMAQGETNPEIAAVLVLETSTVRSHANHIYAKLGVNNRMEAVNAARALGLLTSTQELSPVAAAILILFQVQPSAWDELLSVGAVDEGGLT